MKPEIVKKNEEIKVGMFLSILGVLVFMLSAYLTYFYNTEPQRLLREDSASFMYVAIAFVVSIISAVVGVRAILATYKNLMSLSSK